MNQGPYTPQFQSDRDMPEHVRAWLERTKKLHKYVPQPRNQEAVGGYLGRAIHLASYTWEGVAMGMLMEMFAYLFKTTVLPAELTERIKYNEMPDELKYIPGETQIYKAYFDNKGELRLSNELIEEGVEPTEAMILANGYMMEPTREIGLRNRMREYMEGISGDSYAQGTFLEKVESFVRGDIARQGKKAPSIVEMQASGMLPRMV